jgi:peptide/nickel transport system substrate-binding protein
MKDELLNRDGTLREKYVNRFQLQKSPFLNTEHIGFNIDKSFKDDAVSNTDFRKALSYAIDRNKLIIYLRNGVGKEASSGFVPTGLPGYPYAMIPQMHFNTDSARYYLARSGVNPAKMKPLVINTTQDYLELMVFVQKEWSRLGIPVKIEVHPSSFLRQLRKDQKINCWRGSWIADYPDPENYLICFLSDHFSPAGPNYYHYSDIEFDRLMDSSYTSTDEEERMKILARAEAVMMKDHPAIILYYDESIRLTQKRISGLKSNPMNFLRLREVKKETGKDN